MNERSQSIFICPDCGGPSMATTDGDAMCTECDKRFPIPAGVARKVSPRSPKTSSVAIQRNIVPKGKIAEGDFQNVEKISEPVLEFADLEARKKADSKRRRRRKKRNKRSLRTYLGWILIWVITVGLILVTVSRLQKQFGGNTANALTIEERLVGEEKEFYRSEHSKIFGQFTGFLNSRSVGQMSEFVLDSVKVERKMNRHLKDNTMRRAVTGLKPNPVFWNVAYEESPGFVEVVWDGKEAGFFEGVFVKVDDTWRIDWEQFSRYSSESWTLFRQQIGNSRGGLYRVYVEKVSEGEGSDFKPWIKVRLQPPYEDRRRRELEASEAILLEGGDDITAEIFRLFQDRSGQSDGFSKIWKRDDDDLRRAFLRLEWELDSASGEERIVIKEVLAEHWRNLDVRASDPNADQSKEEVTEDE